MEEKTGTIKYYRKTIKEHGWKGLLQREGWKVVLMVVLFFTVKGTISTLLIIGGFEYIRGLL